MACHACGIELPTSASLTDRCAAYSSQRELVRDRLQTMLPYAIGRLVYDLRNERGYEDVEVTKHSFDPKVSP
jgi:hypothetical protein